MAYRLLIKASREAAADDPTIPLLLDPMIRKTKRM